MRRPAFTLIELLVVVAIIALLLAILLPSLSKAREQAKQARCAVGLKSFGTGFHAYAADNRAFLCSGAFDPAVKSQKRDGPVDQIGWVADLVNHKLAFPATQLCPSNPARYNQKLGVNTPPEDRYSGAQARDLIARGYNTNYTQGWYMARTQFRGNFALGNEKSVPGTLGPMQVGRWAKVNDARIPILGDGRTDNLDNGDFVLNEASVKTMSDGPYGGP
jgi:prepilin-type N-terminal cleavage/methylation domain-containing protein